MKKTGKSLGKGAVNFPSIRDLQLFRDLFELLRGGETTVLEVVQLLKAKGWNVDAPVLYRKLGRLESLTRPAGHRGEWLLVKRSRGGRKAGLTEEGVRYSEGVSRLLISYQELLGPLVPPCETVGIGATNAIITYLLPSVFMESNYLKGHPTIDIRIFEGEWWEILEKLIDGRIALGLGPEVPPGPQYKAILLQKLRRILICPAGHRRFDDYQDGGPFPLDRLAEETVFVLPEGVQPDFRADLVLPPPRPGVGRRITLPSYAEMHVWVKHGLGVAFSLDKLTAPGDEPDLIKRIDVSGQFGFTPIYLYLPRGGLRRLAPGARALAERVIEVFKAGSDRRVS